MCCLLQTIIQFGYPYSPAFTGSKLIVGIVFALLPWALLSKGFTDLGLAASGSNPGLQWGQRDRCGD